MDTFLLFLFPGLGVLVGVGIGVLISRRSTAPEKNVVPVKRRTPHRYLFRDHVMAEFIDNPGDKEPWGVYAVNDSTGAMIDPASRFYTDTEEHAVEIMDWMQAAANRNRKDSSEKGGAHAPDGAGASNI